MWLADRREQFARFGTRVYALSNQPREKLQDLQEELGLGVTLLSDAEGEAIAIFGMTDPMGMPEPTVARSGTFLIDRKGSVRRRWLTTNYRQRPDPDEILAAAR